MSSSPLRFCMATTFYPPFHFGGDAIAVQRLSRALVRAGHEVTVVHDVDAYRATGAPGPSTHEAGDSDEGVAVVRLESSVPRAAALLTQQTGHPIVHGRQLRKLLDGGNFDVVNFHNVSLLGGPGLLHRGGTAARVYMAHEHWLVCQTHVLWRFGRELCTGRKCLRCQLSYRRPPQLWRHTGTMTRGLRMVDTFIAMSEFSREKHREFGFPFEMEVLPNFLPELTGEDLPLDHSPHPRPYFLFAGRLERIKGVDDLVDCSAAYPDADVLIAGAGSEEADLRARTANNPRIRFLGRLGAEELSAYYRFALALVVPSICFETFGLGVIEAFRQGTPVIARRLGPLPELIAQAGAGLLFTDGDELAMAMRRIQHEAGLHARFSDAGRAAFARHWTDSVVVPRYLDIVREAIVRAGRRAAHHAGRVVA